LVPLSAHRWLINQPGQPLIHAPFPERHTDISLYHLAIFDEMTLK
jgi:hypothetical protein